MILMGRRTDPIPIQPDQGIPLIDCHCHFPSEEPRRGMKDSYEVQYANFFRDNGQIIVTSTSIWSVEYIRKFMKSHPHMLLTIGWGAQATTFATPQEFKEDYPRFLKFVKEKPEAYAVIGEIGIDFHHAKTLQKREHQIDVFQEIIQETKHLGKPYSLHVRNPGPNDIDPRSKIPDYNDRSICNDIILNALEEENIPPSDVMWHCFSGPPEWGPILAEKGYYISIPSSAFGFKKWRRNIKGVPLKQLLVETDSSYQHPLTMGAFNEPRNVKYAIAAIAYENNLDQMIVANQILKNAKKFFRVK